MVWARFAIERIRCAGPHPFPSFLRLLYNTPWEEKVSRTMGRVASTVPPLLTWLLAAAAWMSLPAFAQRGMGFNPSGMWTAMYHEDELERTDRARGGRLPRHPESMTRNDCAPIHGTAILFRCCSTSAFRTRPRTPCAGRPV